MSSAILEVCQKAYKYNGDKWPVAQVPALRTSQIEMLSTANVIKIWNKDHKNPYEQVNTNPNGQSRVSASVAAYAMLSVCVLSITTVTILVPKVLEQQRELEEELTVSNKT